MLYDQKQRTIEKESDNFITIVLNLVIIHAVNFISFITEIIYYLCYLK